MHAEADAVEQRAMDGGCNGDPQTRHAASWHFARDLGRDTEGQFRHPAGMSSGPAHPYRRD
jgi:hypothetical protein